MKWVLKLFRGYIFERAVAMIAAKLRKDRALIYALEQYRADGSFLSILRSYAAETEVKADDAFLAGWDEIEAELKRRPFRDLLSHYLAGVKLPDLDGDPENDIALTEAIEKVIDETLRQ